MSHSVSQHSFDNRYSTTANHFNNSNISNINPDVTSHIIPNNDIGHPQIVDKFSMLNAPPPPSSTSAASYTDAFSSSSPSSSSSSSSSFSPSIVIGNCSNSNHNLGIAKISNSSSSNNNNDTIINNIGNQSTSLFSKESISPITDKSPRETNFKNLDLGLNLATDTGTPFSDELSPPNSIGLDLTKLKVDPRSFSPRSLSDRDSSSHSSPSGVFSNCFPGCGGGGSLFPNPFILKNGFPPLALQQNHPLMAASMPGAVYGDTSAGTTAPFKSEASPIANGFSGRSPVDDPDQTMGNNDSNLLHHDGTPNSSNNSNDISNKSGNIGSASADSKHPKMTVISGDSGVLNTSTIASCASLDETPGLNNSEQTKERTTTSSSPLSSPSSSTSTAAPQLSASSQQSSITSSSLPSSTASSSVSASAPTAAPAPSSSSLPSSSSHSHHNLFDSSSYIAARLADTSSYHKGYDAYSKMLEGYERLGGGKMGMDDSKMAESLYGKGMALSLSLSSPTSTSSVSGTTPTSGMDSYSKHMEAMANGYKSSLSPSSAALIKAESIHPLGNLGLTNGSVFPKPEVGAGSERERERREGSKSDGTSPASLSPPHALPSILNFSANHLRGLASQEGGLASYLNSYAMGGPTGPTGSTSTGGDSRSGSGGGGGGGSGSGGSDGGVSRSSPNNKLACRFCGKTFSQAGYIKVSIPI